MTWHTVHTVLIYEERFNPYLGERKESGKNHPGFPTQPHVLKTDQLLFCSIQNSVLFPAGVIIRNRNPFLYLYHPSSIRKEQKHLKRSSGVPKAKEGIHGWELAVT